MKKLWLLVALVALGGLAVNSFADVQNIRLSGDIRVRGYYLQNSGNDGVGDQVQGNTSFFTQRTRVSVEADLEDHVLVVVTLAANGLWGDSNTTAYDAGNNTDRAWDVGFNEAYIQLNEIFYSAATLKVGRQYLMYGRGLIISSIDQTYNYDAGRLVLDYYPLTIDIVGAELVNNQAYSPTPAHLGGSQLLWVHARYERSSDSRLRAIEGYAGWVSQGDTMTFNPAVPPTANGASPWILGGRLELSPMENWTTSAEAAYEGGASGPTSSETISAWIAQLASRIVFKDASLTPTINFGSTWASGGGNGQGGAGGVGASQFVPWFNDQEGLNGYIFCPAMSNIHIVNAGVSIKPYENTSLSVQGYMYRKMDSDSFAGSDPNLDYGGLSGWQTSSGRTLGYEIDNVLGYDYSKDVRFQLIYGMFFPGNAYKNDTDYGAKMVSELRGEVNVKF